MADDQQLSQQDISDLQEISSKLPAGHPTQKKISLLLNAGPTQFEKDRTPAEPAYQSGPRSFLRAAGLPESISDIPDWAKRLTGQKKGQEPSWQPAVNALKSPTEENIVNAVPFVGPNAVQMSRDVQAGRPLDALATLAGTVAPFRGAPQIPEGLRASRAQLADMTRTSSGELKPGVKGVATVVGSTTGGLIGHSTGIPGAATGGSVAGALAGNQLADSLLPNRPAPIDFKGGAYSDYAGESPKAVPLTQGPDAAQYAITRAQQRAALRQSVAPDTTVTRPSTTAPSPAGEGRPATWSEDTVRQLAAWGDPDAIQQAQLRGYGRIPLKFSVSDSEVTPRSSATFLDDPSATSVVDLLRSLRSQS